jgi:hypothetical protein
MIEFGFSSLNDSFAHVKRELAASQQNNEMMDFMWSAFRKVAGINNKKPTDEDENEDGKNNVSTIFNSMNKNNADAPLANFETDDL